MIQLQILWSRIYDRGVNNTDWLKDIIIDKDNNIIISGWTMELVMIF